MSPEEYLRARAKFHRLIDKPATADNIRRLAEVTRELAKHDGIDDWPLTGQNPNPWPPSRIAVWGLGLFAFLLLAGMAIEKLLGGN